MDARPIGMFDSGVGGLSILGHVQRLAPSEALVYFADNLYFPYGQRPAADVRKRALVITAELLAHDAKLIVVACNTASAAAIKELRGGFSVPFVGMVPGLKPAANASRSRHVAILATPGTFDGDLYALVVDEFGAGTRIANVPAHGLAELVEQGRAGTPEARRSIRAALEAEVEAGADTVVLGCTHYHFLGEDIRGEFPALAIVDTSEAVARRTLQVLKESGLEAPQDGPGAVKFVTSGDREAFLRVAGRLGFAAPSEARR